VTDDVGAPLMGGRTPLYYLTDIDQMMGSRPGKGRRRT